ncbi:hypothetical protein LUZ60_017587 [Juncus effusus]|nr:hypothetical protein LUZ60_017587 [Juncus effusus]
MAAAFTRISYWLMRGDQKKSRRPSKSSPKSTPSNDFPSEPGSVKFNFAPGSSSSSTRRIRETHKNSKQKQVDKEYDMVIVPSDGGILSGSESDGSDWSIGWQEPHPQEFCNSEGESEDSFSVLVPCYGRGRADLYQLERNNVGSIGFGVRDSIRDEFSENKDFLEQWLSSLPSELL